MVQKIIWEKKIIVTRATLCLNPKGLAWNIGKEIFFKGVTDYGHNKVSCLNGTFASFSLFYVIRDCSKTSNINKFFGNLYLFH